MKKEVEQSKKIFLLRHAHCLEGVENPGLSDFGKEQAEKLAEKIKNNLGGTTEVVTIWTSPANRATETALIIRKELSCLYYVERSRLWSDKNHLNYDPMWFRELLNKFDDRILIVVSHLPYVQQFPKQLGFNENNSGYAQGVLIENGKCINF